VEAAVRTISCCYARHWPIKGFTPKLPVVSFSDDRTHFVELDHIIGQVTFLICGPFLLTHDAGNAGKDMDQYVPSGPDPSFVQCPNCGRSFNESAAERHIPKCQVGECVNFVLIIESMAEYFCSHICAEYQGSTKAINAGIRKSSSICFCEKRGNCFCEAEVLKNDRGLCCILKSYT
jgi:hypothetical protein